jgi:hemerythrin
MALFKWDESCSVRVPEFDQHHQHIFSLGNRLAEAIISGPAQLATAGILDELVSYTQFHFAAEETFMREEGFCALAQHEAEHTAIASQVLDFQVRQKMGNSELPIELILFLREWLTHHILNTDMKYGLTRPRCYTR